MTTDECFRKLIELIRPVLESGDEATMEQVYETKKAAIQLLEKFKAMPKTLIGVSYDIDFTDVLFTTQDKRDKWVKTQPEKYPSAWDSELVLDPEPCVT